LRPICRGGGAEKLADLLAAAIACNVSLKVKRLQSAQPLLSGMVVERQVVGGVYDLTIGKVGPFGVL